MWVLTAYKFTSLVPYTACNSFDFDWSCRKKLSRWQQNCWSAKLLRCWWCEKRRRFLLDAVFFLRSRLCFPRFFWKSLSEIIDWIWRWLIEFASFFCLAGSATLGCFIFGFSDGAFIAQHAAGLEEHFQSVEPKRMSSCAYVCLWPCEYLWNVLVIWTELSLMNLLFYLFCLCFGFGFVMLWTLAGTRCLDSSVWASRHEDVTHWPFKTQLTGQHGTTACPIVAVATSQWADAAWWNKEVPMRVWVCMYFCVSLWVSKVRKGIRCDR